MRILLTGADGQLGRAIVRESRDSDIVILSHGREQLDITDRHQFDETVGNLLPDMVINAAAYTQVDLAESHPEAAHAVNAAAPGRMAAICAERKIPLIHVSTDFVFDGDTDRPYREDDPVRPLGVYGRTKADGETAVRENCETHLIIRTSWLYDGVGKNFATTILRLARERETLRVVADQKGCPTSAADLAQAILTMTRRIRIAGDRWGTYHFCNHGITTWHGFAQAIVSEARASTTLRVRRIDAISTAEYPTPARRPAFSALDCTRVAQVFNIQPPPWRESLAAVLRDALQGNGALPVPDRPNES